MFLVQLFEQVLQIFVVTVGIGNSPGIYFFSILLALGGIQPEVENILINSYDFADHMMSAGLKYQIKSNLNIKIYRSTPESTNENIFHHRKHILAD